MDRTCLWCRQNMPDRSKSQMPQRIGHMETTKVENEDLHMIEGSFEVKLPTIWTDGQAEVGRGREEKSRREKIREEKAKAAGVEPCGQMRDE